MAGGRDGTKSIYWAREFMITTKSNFPFALFAIAVTLSASLVAAEEWSVPLAGNAFHRAPHSGNRLPLLGGALQLEQGKHFSVYFYVDRPGRVNLSVLGRTPSNSIDVVAGVGEQKLTAQVQAAQFKPCPLGEITIAKPGYVRVDLQGASQNDSATAEILELIVESDTDGMRLDYVQNNQGNMYYWGRRGPSVHLQYQLPKDVQVSCAYSEITVPTGQDAVGSYFMANGFAEGYFGIQVNSETQRRVLFSVWSPFHTDNPADIPPEDRIKTVAAGADVKVQEFGNEGSGGQSYLVYPWQAGKTYRFLTEVKPDGKGNTQYTSWFGDKAADQWRLIASFCRPKTDKHLTGFHCFLENFAPEYGNVPRSAHYANQWVYDTEGKWYAIRGAKFTGDNTARTRQRLDYAGGFEQSHFFLRNCGFFSDRVALDSRFARTSKNAVPPQIHWNELPH